MVPKRVMVVDGRTVPFIWFHYQVDDLPLTPYELAVYFHMVRRGSKSGICNESLEHIADQKNISVGAVKKAIRGLIGYGLIRRESRPGRSSDYVIQDISEWHIDKLKAAGWGGHQTTQVMLEPGWSEHQGHQKIDTQVTTDPRVGHQTTQVMLEPGWSEHQGHQKIDTQVTTDPRVGHHRSTGGHQTTHKVDQLSNALVDQKEDREPVFSFCAEENGPSVQEAQVDPLAQFSKPSSPVKIQSSVGDSCSVVPVARLAQADYEILPPAERQNFRLQGKALELDPWLLDTPDNHTQVLCDRGTRCVFNPEFCDFLSQQLAQSPYWQQRPDEPPTNSGIRQLKDLYAIPVGAQRDAEREKMQGLWDKWQGSLAQRQQNAALRSAPSPSAKAHDHNHVPFSQLPDDQQAQIRATMAKLKTIASVGSTRKPQPMPISDSPPASPSVEALEPVSRLEQIMGLPDGPVRDRELQAYYQQQVDGGGAEAIRATPRQANASASQGSKTSLQPLMSALNNDIYAQAGF